MKLFSTRLMPVLALAASALVMTPSARAATAVNADIILGVRAESGTGATKTFVINLGQASQFEGAVNSISLGSIGADLVSTFGATWNSRPAVWWGIGGTIGSFAEINGVPAKTVYGTRSLQSPWLRQNDSTHGAATNKIRSLYTAFAAGSVDGVTAPNAVLQTITDSNNWASFQPGGANAGPAPGTSFAFFNPSVEANFGSGVANAMLHFYRVKPATTGAELDAPGDYLGRFLISNEGAVTFVPVAALGANTVAIESATYSVNEADGSLNVKVTRSGDVSSAASVTIGVTGGTADTPDDFTFTGGVVSFAIGETEKTQSITIVNRSGFQGPRTIILGLSSPTNATLGATSSSTVTINEAIEPSVVDLADILVTVNAESPTVTINVVRTEGQAPTTVDIQTTDGTAIAGTDFTAPTGGTQTVNFGADATTGTATISLLNPAGMTQNRTFTVSLTNPGANTSIAGTTPMTTVRILAPDSTLPTVGITSPLANAMIQATTSPTVTVTGTATDNIEVSSVQFSLNGGLFTSVTGLANWSKVITPVGGVNTITVRATDPRGNIGTATRSFTYIKLGGLTVATNPANGASGTATGGLAGATAYQVGKTYTLTAKPKTGFSFKDWTVPGLSGAAVESPVLTFVYSEAILAAPTITANFVASPFAPAEIGEFNGLVVPNVGTTSSNSTNGSVKITVTKTGAFTGTLLIDGYKLTIPGSTFTSEGGAFFGVSGARSVLVDRKTKPALELTNVKWDEATNTITGTVKQYYRNTVIAESTFTADRAGFGAANKLPPTSPYLANGGLFTVIIPTKAQTSGLTTAEYPQGDGVGAITLTSNGVLKLAAKLADDTSVTASVPLSSDLKAPLFAQLYSTKGSFTALVQLNSAATDSDLKAVDCLWFRPWQTAMQWYPWGWEEGLVLDLYGASYSKVNPVVPDLEQPANTTIANAELMFSDGLLDNTIEANVNITDKGAVKTLASPTATDKSFKLTVGSATGDLSGTFTHTNGTIPKFVGKLYQKGPFKGGYGFFMTVKPKVVDGLGESGGMSLDAIDLDTVNNGPSTSATPAPTLPPVTGGRFTSRVN